MENNILSSVLWFIPLFITTWGVLFAIMQYQNKRGHSKKRIVIKSLLISLVASLTLTFFVQFIINFIINKEVNLSITIGNHSIEENEINKIAYGFSSCDYPISAYLPIYVKNPSKHKLNNLSVTISYDDKSLLSTWADTIAKQSILGPLRNDQLTRQTFDNHDMLVSSIILNSIDKQGNVFFAEPILWTYDYLFQLSRLNIPKVYLEIRISGDRIKKSTYRLELIGIPARSFNELVSIISNNEEFSKIKTCIFPILEPKRKDDKIVFYLSDPMHDLYNP